MSIVNGKLQTPMGLPSNLNFEMPSSMIDCAKLENRITPYGNATFNSGGQVIRFVIPKTDRSFMNPQTAYITGQCDLGGTFGTGGPGTDLNFVLGNYWSMFSRYVVSSNGSVLETIEKPAELINMILNMTMNAAEKKGQANSLGYYCDPTTDGDFTTNMCQPINTTANDFNNGKTWTFAIPLIGILNVAKQIPLINGDITIELTINALTNWLIGNTTTATAAVATITFALTNMEFVYDQLTLSPQSYAMVMAPYGDKIHIKTESYDFGSGTAAILTAGAVDVPVNIKRSSLKRVFCYFTQSNLVDKTFGGVNPNGNDIVFISNGQQYPQRPIKLNNPSECYMQIQKAFGSIYSTSHSGCSGKAEFMRRSTIGTVGLPNSTGNKYLAAATTVNSTILTGANKFYIAIDTELVNYNTENLYNGMAMGVNSNFRLNVADDGGGAITLTPYFWLNYDAIIEFDLTNGITSVIR